MFQIDNLRNLYTLYQVQWTFPEFSLQKCLLRPCMCTKEKLKVLRSYYAFNSTREMDALMSILFCLSSVYLTSSLLFFWVALWWCHWVEDLLEWYMLFYMFWQNSHVNSYCCYKSFLNFSRYFVTIILSVINDNFLHLWYIHCCIYH